MGLRQRLKQKNCVLRHIELEQLMDTAKRIEEKNYRIYSPFSGSGLVKSKPTLNSN